MEQEKQVTFKSWIGLSSQIENTAYNYLGKVLTVKYKSSGYYDYHKVPEEKWKELLKAESIGTFINREIKPNYAFTKKEV